MLSISRIKHLRSLHIKKYRLSHQKCVIEGHRLVNEALNAGANIEHIWYSENYAEKNSSFINLLNQSKILHETTSEKSLSQVCDSQHHQGIVALVTIPQHTSFSVDNSPILILDNISDPGNMGTLLRTAEWFGLKNVMLTPQCVDPYNSKVIRSAMGAHFHLEQLIQIELNDVISSLKASDYKLIGAVMDGAPVDTLLLPEKWALVLGNEAHGLSSQILSHVDEKVTIPKHGNIESLNVAVAGGVILERLVNNTSY